ncbi:hypothetical protein D3C80_1869720 [compost metagenome]
MISVERLVLNMFLPEVDTSVKSITAVSAGAISPPAGTAAVVSSFGFTKPLISLVNKNATSITIAPISTICLERILFIMAIKLLR